MTETEPVDPDTKIATYLNLKQKYRQYLDTIDPEDRSKAANIIFESIINGQEQAHRKKIIDNSVMWSCFGFIFLLISYLMNPVSFQQYLSITIGVFLFGYGTIGGVLQHYALRRTNNHR